MSDDLARLARILDDGASRLSAEGITDEEAAAVAEELSRAASEAAALVERALREQIPAPRAPGQGSLPLED